MEMHALILSLLILSIVSSSESRSLETVTCATTCTEPANVAFRQGYSYEYQYTASVRSSFNANSEDYASTNLNAQVVVDALGPCEYVLRITSARLRSPDQTVSSESLSAWENSLRENPLHFSWQNGKIPDVCASTNDPTWVLNIKRGILSTLQVSSVETVEAIEETDVTGTCESSYNVTNEGQSREIVKRKNFDSCEGRERHLLFTFFTPYSSESPRQNFVHSSQTCTQQLSGSEVTETVCREKHTFRPFSNEDSGAQTSIEQRMVWRRRTSYYSADTLTAGNARRTNMIFENEDEATVQSRDISAVRSLFEDLCMMMDEEAYEQVGKGFIRLVFLLRRLDASAIEQVESSLNGVCPRSETTFREMFKDALQWCGGEGCVIFSARQIARGADVIPDQTARSWLNGMNLITKPTHNMLSAVMEIVDSGRLMDKTYLTAGNMINRLCEDSSTDCMVNPAMRRTLATFEEKLGTNCRTTTEDKKQEIVLALRALGNAGRTNSITTLASCATEEDNDMETRIAAIKAFRRMPCNSDRSALSTLLFRMTEDSEIRINSYLALMKCPTPRLIQDLVILLDDVENQQVASFVWSHLNQVLESKDPLKGYMKPLILETAFAKSHDLDPRKYSKYYEASVFSEELNAGATVESSLIWSPKSFVPRSAELGLSVDIFGQAVNLFEAGGRVEGVEKMIQNMLASDGFKNNPLGHLFMGSDDDEDDAEEEVEEGEVRVSRSPDDTVLVEKRDQFQRQNRKNLDQGEPTGNWYMRVFGNEMMYGNARTLGTRRENFNAQSIMAQLLQGGQYQYHDDTMLMNSIHILPTGAGLPLTIAFNSSASVDVSINGNMDMTSLFRSTPSLDIHGSMAPRAVVVVSGTMSVDAHVTKSGIATETTAITSWNLGGTASIENGQSFSVRIDAPYQTNTLFEFRHSVLKINGEEMQELGSSQLNNNVDCSNEIVGQRFCISSPRTMEVYPMRGPIELSAYMDKTDRSFSQYVMEGRYESQSEAGKMLPTSFDLSINLDTPRSRVDRATTITFTYDLNDMNFDFNFNRASNVITMNGQVESEPNRRSVTVAYNANNQSTVFNGVAEKVILNGVTTWTTSTSLQIPGKTISGHASATVNPSQKLAASLQITNLLSTPVLMNMTLQDKSEGSSDRLWYYGDSKLKIPGLVDTGGNFNLKFQPRSDNFKFRLSYQFGNMEQKEIVFNHKRRNRSTASVTEWEAEQKLSITQFPLFNHYIELNYRNAEQSVDSLVKFEYGRNAGRRGNNKYVLMNETLSYFNDGSRRGIDASGIIDIPPADVTYSATLNHVSSDASMDTSLALGSYRMHLFLQDNSLRDGLINRIARLETPTPWGILLVNNSIAETRRSVYSMQSVLRLGSASGLSLNANCNIENLSNRKSVSVEVVGNRRIFLSASSVLEMRLDHFAFENSITSVYNNQVQFNMNYDRNETGSTSSLFFQHVPNTYFNAQFVVRNEDGSYHRLARIDFNTPQGMRHYVRLQGNKVVTDNSCNSTIIFDTDFPNTNAVSSLTVSGEMTKAEGRKMIGAWMRKNNHEYLGFDSTAEMEERGSSVTADVNVNVRESFTSTPYNVVIRCHVNKENDEKTVTTNFQLNGRELLDASLTASDHSRLAGDLRHTIPSIPSPVHFVISRQENQASMILRYTLSEPIELSMHLEKNNPKSVSFTLTHNDPELQAFVPSDIDATLHRGTRRSDSGKGIWLTSTINNVKYFNSELMYYPNEMSIQFKVLHNVDGLLALEVPQIEASASASLDNRKHFRASLLLDSVPAVSAELTLSSGNFEFTWMHDMQCLDRCSIPRDIAISFEKSARGTDAEITCQFVVDERRLRVAFEKSEDMGMISYNSTFPFIAGSIAVKLSKFSDRNGYKFIINKGNQMFKTTISGERNRNLIAKMQQDIFGELIPSWPRKVVISVSKTENEIEISSRYNDNTITITGTDNWERESNTGSVMLRYTSSVDLFNAYGVPQRGELRFSRNEDNVATANIEANWRRNSIDLTTSIDIPEKSITVDLHHNLNALEELGISEAIHADASLNWELETDVQTIRWSGTLRLDDTEYTVFFNRGLKLNMPAQLNFSVGHNIMMLHNFGVPLEITSNTEISHSSFEGDASVMGSFTTELYRVNLVDNRRVRTRNFVNMLVDVTLFNKQVELSLAHNLPIPIPKVMKLDVRVSNPSENLGVVYKDLKVSVTRDAIKETATFTMNLNRMQENRESLLLGFQHNATWFYQYGVPRDFKITFARRSKYVADISVVYDTMKQSIGFTLDYHSHESKLIVGIEHGFAIIENAGIPMKMGLEVALPIHDHDAEFEIKYIWGPMIKLAHFAVRWDFTDYSFRYRHHHNITSGDYIPKSLRIKHNTYMSNYGFSTRVTTGRSTYATVELEIMPSSEPMEGTLSLTQTFVDSDDLAKRITLSGEIAQNYHTRLNLEMDRVEKWTISITPNYNIEEWTGSVEITNSQSLFDNISENIQLFANASYGEEITSYLRITRTGKPTFMVGYRCGFDLDNLVGHVELRHAQDSWARQVPKHVRMDVRYRSTGQGSYIHVEQRHMLTINTVRGEVTNQISATTSFTTIFDSGITLYGDIHINQNFDEFERVPRESRFSYMLEKLQEPSFIIQANVTLDDVDYIHSIDATYDLADGVTASLEILLNNAYLNENYHVPARLGGSLSASWEDEISSSLMTTYGDKMFGMQLSTDKETTAEFEVSQTWKPSYQQFNIVISRSEDNEITMSVTIDGTQKDVTLNGNWNENSGRIEFQHPFEVERIPNHVIVEASYRLTPDYFMSLDANIDGQPHHIEGGFNKLENGFHVTSTLLDSVPRSATIRHNISPGGFSLDLDHNIPELVEYVPGSAAVSASLKLEPQFNMTIAVRREEETQRFSTELNIQRLQFTLKHDFEMLPFPRSVSVNLKKSTSPLSYEVCVRIDDLERTVRATFDSTRMLAEFFHSIPELDRWFVARSVAIGFKHTTEPIGGEIYLSVDGVARRVGGSLNYVDRTFNIFQSMPEGQEYPRNVTLKLEGTLIPLNGRIRLTMDESERSVAAEVQPRSVFAALTVRIPETEEYIPRHMLISGDFNSSSGHIMLSLFKNGKNQTVSAGLIVQDGLSVSFLHDVDILEQIPSPINFRGSIEDYTLAAELTLGVSVYEMSSEVLVNENKWYGLHLRGTHNNHDLTANHGITSPVEILAKGRKQGNDYKVNTIVNIFEEHLYNSQATITPTLKKKRKSLEASYSHNYGDMQRSVTGAISLITRSNYQFEISGEQTLPEERHITIGSSVTNNFDDQYEMTSTFSSNHNIPKLEGYIPRSISLERAVVTIDPQRLMVEWEGAIEIDSDTSSTSGEMRMYTTSEKMGMTANMIVQSGGFDKAFTFAGLYTAESENNRLSYEASTTDRTTGQNERNDHITFTTSNSSPKASARIEYVELNNYGIPRSMDFGFSRNDEGYNKHWVFNFTIDDIQFTWKIDFVMQKSPFFLNVGSSLDSSVSYFDGVMPTHALAYFTTDVDTATSIFVNETLRLEYNEANFKYNVIVNRNNSHGNFRSVIDHNIPKLREWLGWTEYVEEYWYNIQDPVFDLYGFVTLDGVQKGNYSFELNYNTKEFSYSSRYDDEGYNVVYKNIYTEAEKRFLFSISYNARNVFKIDIDYTPASESRFELENHYGYDFEIEITGSKSDAGLTANATVTFDCEEGTCTSTIHIAPDFVEHLAGYRLTWNCRNPERTTNLVATIGFDDSYTSGGLVYSLTGLEDDVSANMSYSLTSADLEIQQGRKQLQVHLRNNGGDGINLSGSFSYHNIPFFSNKNVPRNIETQIQIRAPTSASIVVTANRRTVVDFHLEPSRCSFFVKNMDREYIVNTEGYYTLGARKQVTVNFMSDTLNMNWTAGGSLTLFGDSTGNSSLTIYVVNNVNRKRFDFNAFALPAFTYDAEDFSGQLTTSSTFDMLRFSVLLKCRSNYMKSSLHYIGNYEARYNDQVFSVDIDFQPYNYTLVVAQPLIEATPKITLHFDRRFAVGVEQYQIGRFNFSWSDRDEDKFNLLNKFRFTGTKLFYSLEMTQPSAILDVEKCGIVVDGHFSSGDIRFGVNSYLNDFDLGVNITYNGVLPQVMGSHRLVVDITQPIFYSIPYQFTTTGDITITSSSYSSEWSIGNGETKYAVLDKHFALQDSGVTMDFLWRQSFYNIPFHYINMEAHTNRIEKQGSASLQIDGMSEISGNYHLAEDTENNNKTLMVHFASGPLPVGFRTLDLTSWYMTETGRKTGPKVSISSVIDGELYHLYVEREKIESTSTSRSKNAIKVAHPLELNVFGIPLANQVDAEMTVLNRNRGSKLILNYNDNFLQNPFKSSTTYRFNEGSSLFQATADVETDAEYKLKFIVASESITVSAKCPEKRLNMEVVLSGQNTRNRFMVGVSAKNYTADPIGIREASFAFDKTEKTIEVVLDSPNMNRTVLRGNLREVIQQMRSMMKRLASEASSSRIQFIKGMEATSTGYDIYIGYDVTDDASYTMHLLVGKDEGSNFVALQVKKNFELEAEVARVGVKLIDSRLVQLKFSANPTLVNFVRKTIEDMDTEATQKINAIADCLIEGLQSLKTIVVGNPEVESNVNGRIDAIIANVNHYRDQVIRLIAAVASDSNNKFSLASLATEEGVRNALTSLLNLVDSGRNLILHPFTEVFDQYFGVMLNRTNEALVRTMQPVIIVLRKFNAGELLIDLIEEATHKTFEHIMTNGEAYFVSVRQPMADLLYVDESNVILNIPLAFEVDGLKPMPSLNDIKTWLARSALAMTVNDAMEKLYSYIDDYYKARALVYMPRDEMLPPFKGHAFVSGFRHFSTFDKKQYDFSSGCATSHVLAADMRENNFTVALSYADPDVEDSRNAIEVIVGNRRVTVYDDYQVKVNNRVKELPIDLEVMSVMLEGNTIHVRRSEGDMDVACDFKKKLCTVDISPYYFGATAGMAGVFNNEPMDDFKTPTGTADTPTNFARAWESSGTYCDEPNTFRPCASNNVPARCNALFKESDSPLRPCFPSVDPQPFLEMCQNDLCDGSDTKLACSAVHAYAYRCGLLGAQIQLPSECVECTNVDRSTYDASESQDSTISAMDMVLVVEQGSCLSPSGVASSMRKFLKKLGSSLSDARMRDVHYHLVGYGGPGPAAMPSTVTIRNKQHTRSRNHLLKAMKKMPLSSEEASADTLGAISYATQLPFRAGAKPVIVVLSCDSCHDSEVSYGNVERQIRKQGIQLHHLPQREILAGSNSKSMFGFDDTNAFSRGSDVTSSAVKPNKEDICEPLATITGGSVWSGSSMMGNNSAFHTKFTNYVVGQVGKGQSQTCKCEMNESGVPTSVCV